MSQIPATIGKYRIERELGRGASSVVYLGQDSFHSRKVAIKQTHAHLLQEPQEAARLRRRLHNEAVLAGRLKHPHIVRLLDADEKADPPYLVLEYVDGLPLSAFAARDRLLPVAQVLDIAFKCGRALEHANGLGMVHRDIKPANLLLREDGELKLADFGMALALRADETQLAGLVGSPAYMSPEQVRDQNCTFHSDMFSLGAVLYELLTGRRAFDAETDFAILYKITAEDPPPASLLRSELSPAVDRLLARTMAKKREQRFPDWPSFCDAVVALSQGLPERQPEERTSERFSQLRGLPFFAEFHDAALWELLRLGSIKRTERGSVLMKEGEPGDSFHMLLEGRVAVRRNGLKLVALGAGETLGEMAYLRPDQPLRTATAVAETDVLTLRVPSAGLRSASQELQGAFDKAFIRLLVGRLTTTTEQLGSFDLGLGSN